MMLMITPPQHIQHTNSIHLLLCFHINNCHFYLSFFILSLAERHNIESVPKKIKNKSSIQRNQSELTSQVWERIRMHAYMLVYSHNFPFVQLAFFFFKGYPSEQKDGSPSS